jgi:hypothetical protein
MRRNPDIEIREALRDLPGMSPREALRLFDRALRAGAYGDAAEVRSYAFSLMEESGGFADTSGWYDAWSSMADKAPRLLQRDELREGESVYDPLPRNRDWRRNSAEAEPEEGKDWWEEPRNLREELVLKAFRADPHAPLLGEEMIRYGNYGWTKWEWVHTTPGGHTVAMHFWKTPGGERVQPKFKLVSGEKEWRAEKVRGPSSPMGYAIDDVDVPQDLREKLVYEIVMGGTQPENERRLAFTGVTKEPFISLLRDGWSKWQHRHVSKAGLLTVVNFWKSESGERLFPKFIREARPIAEERHFEVEDPAYAKKLKRIRSLKQPNRRRRS